MDSLRVIQFVTDVAYLLLGVAAVRAAIRSHERARLDVALLFGSLAVAVAVQEAQLLSCLPGGSCISSPVLTDLTVIVILILPYALLRLVDDIAEVPGWQVWLTLVALVALGASFIAAGPTPPSWLVLLLLVYLCVGTIYSAAAFVRRARTGVGLMRRRMAAIAWGCALLAATFVIATVSAALPTSEALTPIARLITLISGLCFWAGFFPPAWLSQAWRLPELLEYLRPTRALATHTDTTLDSEALAFERLISATDRTTGARRTLLILADPHANDLYLWSAPSARVSADGGIIGQALRSMRPAVIRSLQPQDLPESIIAVFGRDQLPRTAMLVPIAINQRPAGVLAAFADKGPMFVEDDLSMVQFFAGEAAASLQMQRLRETTSELEALREADRLKDEFMAVVSHELRTPLTAISGYADILLRNISGPLNERQERQTVGIRDAARRLLSLINDLLDVSKLQAGTLDLHVAALDSHAALVRAVASTRVIAVTKGVQIEVETPETEVAPVLADDDRLQQILTNLLINAIKFTPQGGRVTADATAEPSKRTPGGTEILFRVRDTGVGLAPGQATRIWDRFYQAESTATRRFGGAGLGLSIVRRLAELHGGEAQATSAGLGHGSTFLVRLPAAATSMAVVDAPAAQAPLATVAVDGPGPASGWPLVLVVEDDPHIATVLRTYLEADGYRVEVVTDGQIAIQAARSLSPFAITLDISLPKLDGWSVLNALKREPTTSEIPVIVVSILDNRDFGLVLGATDYLVKPIDNERLRGVLRRLSNGSQTSPGSILVVDDDPSVLDVFTSLLTADGWRVMTAPDGEAALATVARERPSAMLLDLTLPGVDGFEVMRCVRSQPATRDLPIIVVTAKDLTDEDRQRLAEGAQRVVLKAALRLEDLRRELRQLLEQHQERAGSSA
ncbi:MAG: response regulator [Chloroflexi bacterium]|nr:response regulator [Chloroflexota bacterium]